MTNKHFSFINQSTKTFLVVFSFLILSGFSFGQTKAEALQSLKETFATNFVKTPIYKSDSKKNIAYSYDYELTETYIFIKETHSDGPDLITTWTRVPYTKVDGIALLEKSDVFKKTSALQFQPPFGGAFYTSNKKSDDDMMYYVQFINIPFNNAEDKAIFGSLLSAIKVLKKEEKKVEKVVVTESESEKIETIFSKEKTYPGISLQQFDVFTKDSTKVNLQESIDKSRKFKEKATLIVFYSNEFCRPCLVKIDSLLKDNQTSQYNIALINIDSHVNFTKLKKKIVERVPDYTKSSLLLFDLTNSTQAIHNGAAPTFLWVDKKMNIVGSFLGFQIDISTINTVLQKIN